MITNVMNWRPQTPFFYGWLIIIMAALGAFTAISLSQTVMGGIQNFITEDTGWNRRTIALAVTLGTWGSGFSGPLVGRLADRYGPRWLMPIGAIVAGTALLLIARIHSVWQFYIVYIVGRSISNSFLIGIVPRTVAVNFFKRKRNIALSLSAMIRPVGGAILIQIISAVVIVATWREAYIYLAIPSFFLVIPLMLIMRRRPEDIGLLPDGDRAVSPALQVSPERAATRGSKGRSVQGSVGGVQADVDWTPKDALRTRAFWLIGITAALGTLGSATIGFSLVPFLHEEAGITEVQAAGVLSLGIFLAVANLAWGYLADKFTPRTCLIGALVSTSAVTLYLFTVNSTLTAYVFGVLWGIFTGSVGILEHMMLAQYFGRSSYGAISGTLQPLQTGALGLGPLLGALARDTTGSYLGLNGVLVVVYLLAALLIFFARPPSVPSQLTTGPSALVE